MDELTEIRFTDDRLVLADNRVKSAILPRLSAELERDVVIRKNCIIEGAVYARNFQIENGPARIQGAVFTKVELHVDSDAKGIVTFEHSVGSAGSIVSHSPGCRLQFLADVHAGQVRLRNAYVAASIFADDISLEDCVVIGGVFASRNLSLTNCVVGTFNSPSVRAAQSIYLLMPGGFSVEPLSALPGTEFHSLALADLGAIMRGAPEMQNSGKIPIRIPEDEQHTVLTDGETQVILRSYSVSGKVLAADMLDLDRMQNHFLLSAAGLGTQLLRTYDLGTDINGNVIDLTPERISTFFFDILTGRVGVANLSGKFSLADFARA
jgi:hypothetical protein